MKMQAQALNRTNIANAVERKQIGNYWLGHYRSDGHFQAMYVGRSDTCLRRRLMTHSRRGRHDAFITRTTDSIREAYQIECREWHMISRGLSNEIHPRTPRHLPYSCPYCEFLSNFEELDSLDSEGGDY